MCGKGGQVHNDNMLNGIAQVGTASEFVFAERTVLPLALKGGCDKAYLRQLMLSFAVAGNRLIQSVAASLKSALARIEASSPQVPGTSQGDLDELLRLIGETPDIKTLKYLAQNEARQCWSRREKEGGFSSEEYARLMNAVEVRQAQLTVRFLDQVVETEHAFSTSELAKDWIPRAA